MTMCWMTLASLMLVSMVTKLATVDRTLDSPDASEVGSAPYAERAADRSIGKMKRGVVHAVFERFRRDLAVQLWRCLMLPLHAHRSSEE